MLTEQLQLVKQRIFAACQRCGRTPDEVTLIAVSKTKPIPQLETIYKTGMRHFGENKVQELIDKYEHLPKDINWHMIGHLQRNKVKYIVDKVSLIHSVDSIRLAEAIETEAAKKDVVVNVLLEVNVAKEASKFGFTCEEVLTAIETISTFSHIRVQGLMTIAPFVSDAKENRPIFAKMKKLSVDIKAKNIDNISVDILSMGMTGDFEVAIEEGATMVRVGTAIFGEREYCV